MTVEEARGMYLRLAQWAQWHHCPSWLAADEGWSCDFASFVSLKLEAASLAYDVAVAQACEERARRSVAW